ncbi:H-NS family nucleoid-associated regulatory protein [Candidatus Photodesmus blepharus]|uniref:H-NS family histone-like protein n=1 Tax=Candidatus Photodesmus blepharonis TaxID=1179155 RepID=UPI0005508F79|nr:H-NS family nucleoid-associated regulatory protein [Candidatus Photodesmus blepharus]
MKKFTDSFNHIKTLRASLKGLNSEELKKNIDKMSIILKEKIRLEQQKEKKEREKEKQLKEALSEVNRILEFSGLNLQDIILAKATNRKQPTHKLNVNGKEIFYVGSGRIPKEIKKYIDNGGQLDDLKIKTKKN